MTFADYMRTHPDETIRKASEFLYGGKGGTIDLAVALGQLDAAGAPRAAFLAVREAWKEFERCRNLGRNSRRTRTSKKRSHWVE